MPTLSAVPIAASDSIVTVRRSELMVSGLCCRRLCKRWVQRLPAIHTLLKCRVDIEWRVTNESTRAERWLKPCLNPPRWRAIVETDAPASRAKRGDVASGATARRYCSSSTRTRRHHHRPLPPSIEIATKSDISGRLRGVERQVHGRQVGEGQSADGSGSPWK